MNQNHIRGRISHTGLIVILSMAVAGLVVWTKQSIDSRLAMARAHAHYTVAIQTAKQNIAPQARAVDTQYTHTYTSDGVPTVARQLNNTGAWIELLNTRSSRAPLGGPAYVVNSSGNALTGAVGVSATNYGNEVQITRPAFLGLAAVRTIVTTAGIQTSEL